MDVLETVREMVQTRIKEGEVPRGFKDGDRVLPPDYDIPLFSGIPMNTPYPTKLWPNLEKPQYRRWGRWWISLRHRRPYISGLNRSPRLIFEDGVRKLQCSVGRDVVLDDLSEYDLQDLLNRASQIWK